MTVDNFQYELAVIEGAQNPDTLPSTLNRWAERGSKRVRLAVAGNPSAAYSTLVALARDADKTVAALALSTICQTVTSENIAA